MPLIISRQNLIESTRLSAQHINNKFRDVRRVGESMYCTADLLTKLAPFKKYYVDIVKKSFDDRSMLVPDDPDLIRRFGVLCDSYPDFKYRARECKLRFSMALTNNRNAQIFQPFMYGLKSKLLLSSECMTYIFSGKGEAPDSAEWAEAFAMINAPVMPAYLREVA